MCKLNSKVRGYPLNYDIELPRYHNYPTRGYKLRRLGCLHRTNRTVIVNTEERACCLDCCQSDDPRTCSEERAIEPKTTIQNINDRPVFPSYLTGCSAELRRPRLKLKIAGGRTQ